MKNLIAAASLVIAATGCATTPPPVVQQTTEYQFEDAAWAREEGTATVTGAAMVRLKNGQVLHCGALEVAMIPVTDYTFERAQLIYGQSEKIQVSHTADIFSAGPSGVNLEAVHPTEAQDRLVSVGDADGDFEFLDVPAGDWFVHTTAYQERFVGSDNIFVSSTASDRVMWMKRIQVKPGRTNRIVLN